MATRKIWRAERVVLPGGEKPAAIAVEDGTVVGILEKDAPWEADEEVLIPDDQALMPGLIDIHVHVNEPGRTEWEGYETATRAAAAGGFTTLVDMPLNSSPCTTSLENLELKKEAARGKLSMDVGFWGVVQTASYRGTSGSCGPCGKPESSGSNASSAIRGSTSTPTSTGPRCWRR